MKSFESYKILPEHESLTVEAYLKQVLKISGRKIQKLTRSKGLFLNGKTAYLQRKIKRDDTLRVLILQDMSFGVTPEEGPITILYEDDFLLILDKPAYQLVHPAGRTTSGTLANFLAFNLQQRGIICTIRPIHRLDRDTSGCIIFAKSARSQLLLEQQLKAGTLKRTYQALVSGNLVPPDGIINAPIGAHPHLPNRRAVTKNGETAITHYKTIKQLPEASLLEMSLETGRTHQIRVHLTHIGHPIIGDRMYSTRSPLINRQALHAISVSFEHLQENRQVTVNAPIPEDFIQAAEKLSTGLP